jgi:uncharacterized membrane protein
LTESGLGGILHAFKSPFTGLMVGSIAMLIITLICYYADNVWTTIIKSLIIVLIVKMLVSPHSMISAYFAVSFQALLAGVLYHYIGIQKWTIIMLTTLGLVESAMQKIISLTILYGKSIWEAIDALGQWISKNLGYLIPFDSSNAAITTYISMYTVAGIILGFRIHTLIKKIEKSTNNNEYIIDVEERASFGPNQKKKGRWRFIYLSVLIALIIILVLYATGQLSNSYSHALYIFARTLIVIGLWYFLISPILLHYIKKYLSNKKSQISTEVDDVFNIIPYMRYIVHYAWKNSKGIQDFVYKVIMYTIHFKNPKL